MRQRAMRSGIAIDVSPSAHHRLEALVRDLQAAINRLVAEQNANSKRTIARVSGGSSKTAVPAMKLPRFIVLSLSGPASSARQLIGGNELRT